MPLAVRKYLWLDGRWAVPWLTRPTMPLGQQAGQGSVDGRVGLAQDARQLRRVDERRPAEGIEQLSF